MRRPTIDVGGFELVDISPMQTLAALVDAVIEQRQVLAFALHIGGLNARNDVGYRDAFNSGAVRYADGVSVALAGRLAGAQRLRRCPTTDLAPDILRESSSRLGRPLRVALLGGTRRLVETAAATLSEGPHVDATYAVSGYEDDYDAAFEEMIRFRPDVTFVGLGSPYEVLFCRSKHERLPDCPIITCGGWFGFVAGDESRAHNWVQRTGLEWCWRLAQSPRRLSRRYARGMLSLVSVCVAALLARTSGRARQLTERLRRSRQ